jgi:hypothetical protein
MDERRGRGAATRDQPLHVQTPMETVKIYSRRIQVQEILLHVPTQPQNDV